jgi:hypothetical protein
MSGEINNRSTMRKSGFLFLLLILTAKLSVAQILIVPYIEVGYGMGSTKSKEVGIFLEAYNNYYASQGLTAPFDPDMGLAGGRFYHIGVAAGGEEFKAYMGMGQYKLTTRANEARFSNGVGRDIKVELKDFDCDVGFRAEKGPIVFGGQVDIILRNTSIYSWYVFKDGSKSLGGDHSLNGIYSDFNLGAGIGLTAGIKIAVVYVLFKADYIGQIDQKSHPEYHQFHDFEYFTDNYIPREIGGSTYSDNAISNDIKGWRFGISLEILLGEMD